MGQKRELTIEVAFTEADKECLARLVKDLVKLDAKTNKVRAHPPHRPDFGVRTINLEERTFRGARARESLRRVFPSNPTLMRSNHLFCASNPNQGDFKEWLKVTQKGPRRTWHDPARHDWGTLSDFVRAILEKDAETFAPMARRHLGWSRWSARRAAWQKWQEDQPVDQVPESGPWKLVARTRKHPRFPDAYGAAPSHLPGWVRSEKQRPPRWCEEKNLKPKMIGVDCEMCETETDRRALVGVSVVDENGVVLLKTLVRPPGKIVDLKTDITGLKLKDFKGVKVTLEDVQVRLKQIVRPNTVLVGHGLEHDLKALKFDHSPIIDTAFLFSYKNLPRSTPGLADLCKRLLPSFPEMRQNARGTHDSVEDAKMALELAKWESSQPKPTAPLDPPEDKVDARDLCKLFVHRVPRGATKSDLVGVFAKNRRTIGVDHTDAIEAVHGTFLGPETAVDRTRTTSAYVEFKSVEQCNAAFASLRGARGADALGRPQKAVKMVVLGLEGERDSRAALVSRDVANASVAALRAELVRRSMDPEGSKPDLQKRPKDATERENVASKGSERGDASDRDADSEKSDSREDFSQLTVPELREALEARGLDTSVSRPRWWTGWCRRRSGRRRTTTVSVPTRRRRRLVFPAIARRSW